MMDHESSNFESHGKAHSVISASWSVRDLDDGYVVGNIYFDEDADVRRYMATNGANWAFFTELDDAIYWCSENPRPRPRRIVYAQQDREVVAPPKATPPPVPRDVAHPGLSLS